MIKTYTDHSDKPNEYIAQSAIGLFNAAVGGIILNDKNEVLLTQRALHNPVNPGSWEILFGRVNQGEGFEQALHREAMEELGIVIHPSKIVATMHFTRTPQEPEHIGVVFLTHIESDQTVTILPEEIAAYQWLPITNACEIVNEYTRHYLEFVLKEHDRPQSPS